VLGHNCTEFTRRTYARFSPESASLAVLRVLEAARGRDHGSKKANKRFDEMRFDAMKNAVNFYDVKNYIKHLIGLWHQRGTK